MMHTTSNVLERFLRYVQVDTQSARSCRTSPTSSAIQFDPANLLADELRDLGAENVEVTDHAMWWHTFPQALAARTARLGPLSRIWTPRRWSRALV